MRILYTHSVYFKTTSSCFQLLGDVRSDEACLAGAMVLNLWSVGNRRIFKKGLKKPPKPSRLKNLYPGLCTSWPRKILQD